MAKQTITSARLFLTPCISLSLLAVSVLTVQRIEAETGVGQLFAKQTMCPGKVVSLDLCPARGSAEVVGRCALDCAKRSDCYGFLRDTADNVCHLCPQPVDDDCVTNTQDQMGLEAYEKVPTCGLDSRLSRVSNRCELCPAYLTGDHCRETMRDCEDWHVRGAPSGVYWVRPSDTAAAFRVRCSRSYKRNYFMARTARTVLFYRGWSDYAKGFGVPAGDHWLGLERISLMTNARCYDLIFQYTLADGSFYQTFYNSVRVGDASRNFTLDYNINFEYGVPLGDCLGDVKGQPFSTYDADHDGDVSANCAQRHQSGWWMGSVVGGGCTLCNPTGRLLQPADMRRTNADEEVFWTPLQDGSVVPNSVAMWVERCYRV